MARILLFGGSRLVHSVRQKGFVSVRESLRIMSLEQEDAHHHATWMTSAHALDLATRQSAAALRPGNSVGTLAPGYRPDVVLIDVSRPQLQPTHEPAAALVLSARAGT